MKLTFVLAFLVILAVSHALPAKKDKVGLKGTTAPPMKETCNKDCLGSYKPICAGDENGKNKSFGSECVLEKYNCEQNTHLKKVSDGECPGGGGIRLN